MVLAILLVPGRPAYFDYSRARASALAVGASGGAWTIFLFYHFSLSLGDDTILAGDQSWPFFIIFLYLVTEILCLVVL